MNFEISDWVQGRTDAGELVHGYIESIHELLGIARVNVLQSDNEEIIGTIALVSVSKLKKLAMISMEADEQIKALIDIALSTRDEAWFMELSGKLKSKPNGAGQDNGSRPAAYSSFVNRLGLSGKK